MLQDAEMADKLQVYDEVVLECSQPWLEAPGALILPHNGRMFEIKVRLVALRYVRHPILLRTSCPKPMQCRQRLPCRSVATVLRICALQQTGGDEC